MPLTMFICFNANIDASRGTVYIFFAVLVETVEISPLFSASMMELTKQPKDAALLASDPMSGGGGEDTDSPGGIANTRVVNASKVMIYWKR